jgi:hypothetical protein
VRSIFQDNKNDISVFQQGRHNDFQAKLEFKPFSLPVLVAKRGQQLHLAAKTTLTFWDSECASGVDQRHYKN